MRFRKQEELEKDAARLRADAAPGTPVKVLTSCPSCLQGLSRFEHDAGGLDADYVVVELAKHLLGPEWLERYVGVANRGGIERVLRAWRGPSVGRAAPGSSPLLLCAQGFFELTALGSEALRRRAPLVQEALQGRHERIGVRPLGEQGADLPTAGRSRPTASRQASNACNVGKACSRRSCLRRRPCSCGESAPAPLAS